MFGEGLQEVKYTYLFPQQARNNPIRKHPFDMIGYSKIVAKQIRRPSSIFWKRKTPMQKYMCCVL